MKNSRKKQKKRKKSLVGRFFKIMLFILTIYFVGLISFFAYAYLNNDKENNNSNLVTNIVSKVSPKLPERTIGLIACTDSGDNRADAIMLVCYNSINKEISTVSIPRDTKVSIPSDMWNIMVQNFPIIANDNPDMKKINSITYYGKEMGMQFLQEYLEKLLDIKIDYYLKFSFDGFRYIVDSIGGIEFDVPMRMKYSDPTQDLYIDLQPGIQLLDGDKAEQLLRFRKDNYNRGYSRGDLERIEVQQKFIKVFLEKALSINSILSNPKAYLSALNQYVDTNFGATDALKYLPELKNISSENIKSYTIPCSQDMINGHSYVIIDDETAKDFAYDIFKKPTVKQEDIVYEDSFNKSIQILNGSYTSGVASKSKELLEQNNYFVSHIGDFNGEKVEETRIYVAKEGQGTDIQKLFPNSKILVNPEKAENFGYDITVIIGTKRN